MDMVEVSRYYFDGRYDLLNSEKSPSGKVSNFYTLTPQIFSFLSFKNIINIQILEGFRRFTTTTGSRVSLVNMDIDTDLDLSFPAVIIPAAKKPHQIALSSVINHWQKAPPAVRGQNEGVEPPAADFSLMSPYDEISSTGTNQSEDELSSAISQSEDASSVTSQSHMVSSAGASLARTAHRW